MTYFSHTCIYTYTHHYSPVATISFCATCMEFLVHLYQDKKKGRHCCLWCEVAGNELKTPPEQRPPCSSRSLARLKAENAAFAASGSDLRKAKLNHNAPIFDIELAYLHTCMCTYLQVCQPHQLGHPPATLISWNKSAMI